MPPWEENNEELVDDVEIGDVEVVFERRHIDVAAKLRGARRVSKEAEHKESQLEIFRHRKIRVRFALRIPGHA
jgi:hypothetical protein